MGLLLIIRFTLLEALRRRIFLAVVILSAIMLAVFAILLSVGMHFLVANNNSGLSSQLFLLSGGIFIAVMVGWMVYLLSSLLTIVLTAGMISAEVEAGTFAVIVPKPLSRAEIVLGKWLGYALILSVYTALLFLSFLAVIYWQTGYWPPQVLKALGILELETMTLLAITTLGSSLVPTVVNGAIALILFIGAPISSVVQFIVQAISQAQDQAMQNIAITINLVVPTDALWHGTSFYLLPSQNLFAILGVSTRSFNTPFTSAEPLTAAFLAWAVLYSLILPLIAVLLFQRRDL